MKKTGVIKAKHNGQSSTVDQSDNNVWERELAFKENERTVKKLMVEVARLQTFLKGLLENYSLPDNLQEDIKEMVFEQEMTHFDNNNVFFSHLPPLSPISNTLHSSYTNNQSLLSPAINIYAGSQ